MVEVEVCPFGILRTIRSEFLSKRQVHMNMYAVILTGGKQLKVEEGNIVRIEKLDVAAGETVTFDQVAAIGDENGLTIGTPIVSGATVTAKVVANGKGKKIRIFKYTPKKGYRKRQGHRQPYTKVEIAKISF